LENKADIGLAFDGDADRCFLVDENGQAVDPSLLTSLIASRELTKHPGATIIHSLISSRAVVEVINESGGVPVRSRVGHSYIKALMAETGAIFGGEHSGHFYFKDFWRADSGALAALHALAALGESDKTISELLSPFQRYAASGEVNSRVEDVTSVIQKIKEKYEVLPEYSIDELDGLTISSATWWFNIRASNTEPLLRLNVEADTALNMASHRDELLMLINA
jgi:phosphomannomutase